MNLGILAKQVKKLTSDNAPAILTTIGVTGTLTTAYLAAKASFKAADVLRDAAEAKEAEFLEKVTEPGSEGSTSTDSEHLTIQEEIAAVWKLYVPAVATATFTVIAIVGANHIGMRRAAALASAYSVSEKLAAEYKAKVIETVGKKKEETIRSDIAKDRVAANPPTSEIIIVTGENTLCLDTWSGRYFNSDVETLKKAMNDTNYQVNNNFGASLTDFWSRIGLSRTAGSDAIGWSSDKQLELEFSYTSADDGRPVLAVGFLSAPISGYDSSF